MPASVAAAPTNASRQVKSDFVVSIGLMAVVLFFIGSGVLSYANTKALLDGNQQVAHTHEVLAGVSDLLSLVKDAETGQRGYVLTGDAKYLAPYENAVARIGESIGDVERLTADNPDHQARMGELRSNIAAKLAELKETVELRRDKGFEAAETVVLSDRGKGYMDALRGVVEDMKREEGAIRQQRIEEMQASYRSTVVSGGITCLLGVLLSALVAYLVRRASFARARQDWLQSGQVGLSMTMAGDLRLEQLGENILKFLTKYTDAHAGAFFVRDGSDYRRIAAFGLPDNSGTPERFTLGNGLLGAAAKDARTIVINDVPEGYLAAGSGLGKGTPRHLIISPAASEGLVNGILELGYIHPLDGYVTELLENISETISIAIRSANYRANLQDFLEETQRQAEELQAQSEELRVSNEELEEQSRALKDSQGRLEQQQAELEQTNSQLEEQTQQLEIQRDDLAGAKALVDFKAKELEQASRYKSDFLANMSHELRTPLNSSLILAKLLADNPDRNLTAEQVKYALTIQAAGNDLLALINDILDLSKIEAGHMEIRPETVPLSRLVGDLTRMFEPIAQQKGLKFENNIGAGCPGTIDTDRQRLEQVLKNLLSNAFKFTEQGGVTFAISKRADGRIALSVADTGIGVSKEQQKAIFDAFRQADGTISRKYGGTGLGLSISREFARLLGGAIELESEPGKGSTFTLVLPETYDENAVAKPVFNLAPELPADALEPAAPVKPRSGKIKWVEDDRERLTASSHTMLVVEDDEGFARILYDLAHELNFQCIISNTAEEALALAKQYLPSAVVLDVGLPDNSGLSVLDRLKRNPRTRHIPVHVVSGGDYAQKALSLGAIGYMLKPVKREELVDVLKKLESRLDKHLRRVLIVEDDAVQRDSVGKLLGTANVQAVGVGTAAECLERLKTETFDCMVLDLSLPDASGYSLLETLSREDAYSFPPVIVYTGRELSSEEEHRLRRYSKSIIIKGAKSPERLLDEVTLFLHQVVSDLPDAQQRMLEQARNRDAVLEGRRILVVEDDVSNVYALTNILEPEGAVVHIARNGREALTALAAMKEKGEPIDLVLMDVMMPEMDGLTATREIRRMPELKKLPVIMLTAKAMKDDQERCLDAGANDYMAKPLDVEKLLSLVRVWMPR